MLWRVELVQRTDRSEIIKEIEADVFRIAAHTKDLYFCDECDRNADGDYKPKYVVAQGEYRTIERVSQTINKFSNNDFELSSEKI